MKRKLLAALLALLMVLSLLPAAFLPETAVAEDGPIDQAIVQGGAILHCFDWSYNAIKAALPDIAAAGYAAVQTSPVQQPKDYNAAWTTGADEWWKLYQPLGLRIAPDADGTPSSWLGTRDELASLCAAAENCGVKVIVDIVANHLANDGESAGTFAHVSPDVDSDLYHAEYFHTYSDNIRDDNRFTMTQYHMWMPDLNTGNAYIQTQVLNLLKDCIDCGVDGFRFDAAKHIELPNDPAVNGVVYASDFWPTVINGVREYADEELFIYGEILGSAGTDIANYTQYMAVTDNATGNAARENAVGKNAGGLANYVYYKGAAPRDSVLWAESHDTYMDNTTSSVSDANIVKTWAIVGARADSTALFFARPNATMGAASSDTTWKSAEVAAINLFKNHFNGTTEYVASEGSVAYVERGTNGAVICNLGSNAAVSVTAHRIKDGAYTDQISGNAFTVANGVISGTVGSSGVAVVYDPNTAASDSIAASPLYLKPSENWKKDGARFAMYVFNGEGGAWVSMTDADGDGIYEAELPQGEWTKVIFCRMDPAASANNWDNKRNQTGDLVPPSGANLYTVPEDAWDGSGDSGNWSMYGSASAGGEGYYLVGNMTGWNVNPAYKMTANAGAETEEYSFTIDLTTASQFKVVYSADGSATTTWFPDGYGNNYGQNGEITENGTYTVYFRPNHDGGQDWFYSCIYAAFEGASQNEGAGYYIVGNMTGWAINSAYKLTRTAAETEEYSIDVDLTTASQFKVVYSADGTALTQWFPDPSDNYGQNGEITESGTYTVYFRPNYDGGQDWFCNCIYVEKKGAETLADGFYLVDADDPTVENIDPAYQLTKFGTDGHVFNDNTAYVLTGNFGTDTYQIVMVASGAIVPFANGQPPVVTTTGVTETVYLEMANATMYDEWCTGVSSLTGYCLNIGNTPIPQVTADHLFTETAEAGVYKLDRKLYQTSIFVFEVQNGLYVGRYPNLGYDDPENSYLLDYDRYGNGERMARVYFRPDGQGDEENGWYKGFFTDKLLNDVTIAATENGTVTADHTAAVEDGTLVTLTVAPAPGYLLDTLTLTYNDMYWEPHTIEPAPDPEDGTKFTFEMPIYDVTVTAAFAPQPEQKPVLYGEDVDSMDVLVKEDGRILYRYDVRVKGLPDEGIQMNSAQIFLTFDANELAVNRTDGPVNWLISNADGKLFVDWASDQTVPVRNGDVLLSVYFERIGTAETVAVAFTENALGNSSELSFVQDGALTEKEAETIDGSITFVDFLFGDANCDEKVTAADAAAVLRSLVGLSELSMRGAIQADADGVDGISAQDAATILRYVVRLIETLPAEP